jgi:hypothetical protein
MLEPPLLLPLTAALRLPLHTTIHLLGNLKVMAQERRGRDHHIRILRRVVLGLSLKGRRRHHKRRRGQLLHRDMMLNHHLHPHHILRRSRLDHPPRLGLRHPKRLPKHLLGNISIDGRLPRLKPEQRVLLQSPSINQNASHHLLPSPRQNLSRLLSLSLSLSRLHLPNLSQNPNQLRSLNQNPSPSLSPSLSLSRNPSQNPSPNLSQNRPRNPPKPRHLNKRVHGRRLATR